VAKCICRTQKGLLEDGCGLCVTTCTTEAMTLQAKPENMRREPPLTGRDTMMQMANERGKSLVPLAYTRGS